MKSKAFKIAAVVFGALVAALVAVALNGCASASSSALPGTQPVVLTEDAPGLPVVIQAAGENRSLSELLSIARGYVPEPADLSEADRDTVAKMRRK